MKQGIVKIQRGRWHSSAGDLVDQTVELDRRILDHVVGLDTEINELVEGSDLYMPTAQLTQLVLPDAQKERLLEAVSSYEAFRLYRERTAETNATLFAGVGLVVLLCGPSGTGKTMSVNAVAKHFGKRVLMVDFPSLQGKNKGAEDVDLKGLFREAEMNNGTP